MLNSEDEVYRALQKHMESSSVGFPATESGSDIKLLREFFTPEQAQWAMCLGSTPSSPRDVFRKAKRKKLATSLEETEKKLDTLSKEGLVFAFPESPGSEKNLYMNLPLALGLFEFHVDTLTEGMAKAMDEYSREAFYKEWFATGIPQMRTIPIDTALTPENKVMSYDDVWAVIEKMEPPYVLAPCVCTQEKALLGHKCEHELTYRCVPNNLWHLENGHGREITKEELIAHVKRAREEGLVIQPGNYKNGTFFCMCCKDCCGVLEMARQLPRPAEAFATNYHSVVDATACSGCETCVERCPMDAITVDEVASINLDRCIGCGVCVPTCPSEALRLEQNEVLKEPPKNFIDMHMQRMKKKAELQVITKNA